MNIKKIRYDIIYLKSTFTLIQNTVNNSRRSTSENRNNPPTNYQVKIISKHRRA